MIKLAFGLPLFFMCAIALANPAEQRDWKRVVKSAQKNKVGKAIDSLQRILDRDKTTRSEGLLLLTAGRLFYQHGLLDEAIKYYSMVPATSPYYVDATEEQAWAYARKKDYGRALGKLETAMVPMFAHQLNPESYFLKTLIQVRVCNYNGAVKTIDQFKKRYDRKIDELTAIVRTGRNGTSEAILASLASGETRPGKMRVNLNYVPRHVLQDARVLSYGKKPTPWRKNRARKRIKRLARQDIAELKKVVKKLKIAEAEVLQRVHMTHQAKDAGSKSYSDKQVVFAKSSEIWIDEIDKYQVQASQCESLQGKKL